MSFKDILVPVLSAADDEPALAAAEVVADAANGQATALLIGIEPDSVFTLEGAVESGVWADVLARAREESRAEKARLDARPAYGRRAISTRSLTVAAGFTAREVGAQARYADLTVLLQPHEVWQEDVRTAILEAVLFGSGRPVLLVPQAWRRRAIGRKVVIAWNGRREAARALADAAPFLEQADVVTIVVIGAGRDDREPGAKAGDDAAAHLARRGLKADVRNIDDLGGGQGAALLASAEALGADLIVMGGYGHSRVREFVFGGLTRDLVKSSRIPLFMAH
jgi:nucleotide-binding universal stress UspA family protein